MERNYGNAGEQICESLRLFAEAAGVLDNPEAVIALQEQQDHIRKLAAAAEGMWNALSKIRIAVTLVVPGRDPEAVGPIAKLAAIRTFAEEVLEKEEPPCT